MSTRWVYLMLSWDVCIAVSSDDVHRVLHATDKEYSLYAPEARSMARVLSLKTNPDMPGVLLVTRDGACWHVGDADLGAILKAPAFLSVPPYLLKETPAWCRGVLVDGENRVAYVGDLAAMNHLGG